jgi:peptidoglycan/LPS O-acetylase OafA/YrhL
MQFVSYSFFSNGLDVGVRATQLTPFVEFRSIQNEERKTAILPIFYPISGRLFKYQRNRSVMLGSTQAIQNVKMTAAAALVALATGAPVSAAELTAGKIMSDMPARERYSFIAGIVEGLAYTRYQKDGKQPQGMKCIYDWFYADVKIMTDIEQVFTKYADYPPGAVIAVMVEDKCGA